MKKIGLLMMVLSLVALAGCAQRQAAPQPEWISGESTPYPSESYLIGRGQADEAVKARDRARADLAKTFEVSIAEYSHDRQEYSEGSGQEGATHYSELVRDLVTRIERVVRGIEIGAQWQDPQTGTHHALAVLSRTRAAQALRQEIRELDEATQAHLNRAQRAGDEFAKLRAARSAVQAQHQRAGLQRSLRVVDVSGQGVPPRWSLARLQSDRDEILSRISIRPESSGSNASSLRDLLGGALASSGYTVTRAAQYTLFIRLDTQDLEPRDGWHWRAGTLELSLRDNYGQPVGSRRWSLREAATDAKLLDQRILDRVAELLSEEDLTSTLLGFVED